MTTSTDTGLSKKTMQLIWAVLAFMSIGSAILWNLKDTPPNRAIENDAFAKTEQLRAMAEAASKGASAQTIMVMAASVNPGAVAQVQAQFQPKVTNIPTAYCGNEPEKVFASVQSYRKGQNETVVIGHGCAIVQLDGSVNKITADGQYFLGVPAGRPGYYHSCGTIPYEYGYTDCLEFLKKFSTRAVRIVVNDGSLTIK